MDLDIAGQALLKNLNLRREHHGEDVALGLDLRLKLGVDADALVHFGSALKSLLYEGMNLRMPYIKPLQLTCEFKDHVLHIADLSFDGVCFSKFCITAEPEGKVELEFNASISAASTEYLPQLAALLIEEVCNIDIEPAQGSLDLGGKAA